MGNTSIDFGVLNLLPLMVSKIEMLENKLNEIHQHLEPPQIEYDLTKRAGVREFLGVGDATIAKYLREGVFIEGYHFYRDLKGRKSIITFVSGAIEEFKKSKEK